ncbi:MAG: hypothetical protein GXX91_07500, partial [Verrucomicrobiaceae bacterium]|nr:hypothetical protein [Verrucomicrobiaceae bacterium]
MIPLPPVTGRWFPLRDRAIFRLTGPDRVRYLNGQVTNDLENRSLEREAVAACLCTIKGRVEALVWIRADGDSLILDGELAQRELLHARLERYLIADDCEITDESDRLLLVHHFIEGGPGVDCRRFAAGGRDLLLCKGDPDPFDVALLLDESEVARHQLHAMIPAAGREITGEEFPAELGLDELAVSFHKGCYLGQEVLSRIESVGRVKRRLTLIESPFPLAQGVPVVSLHGENGMTTRATVPHGEKSQLGMAIFKISQENEKLIDNQPVAVVPSDTP